MSLQDVFSKGIGKIAQSDLLSSTIALHLYKVGDSNYLQVIHSGGNEEATINMGEDDVSLVQFMRGLVGDIKNARAGAGDAGDMILISYKPRIYAYPEFIKSGWVDIDNKTANIEFYNSNVTLSVQFKYASLARIHLRQKVGAVIERAMPERDHFKIDFKKPEAIHPAPGQ